MTEAKRQALEELLGVIREKREALDAVEQIVRRALDEDAEPARRPPARDLRAVPGIIERRPESRPDAEKKQRRRAPSPLVAAMMTVLGDAPGPLGPLEITKAVAERFAGTPAARRVSRRTVQAALINGRSRFVRVGSGKYTLKR